MYDRISSQTDLGSRDAILMGGACRAGVWSVGAVEHSISSLHEIRKLSGYVWWIAVLHTRLFNTVGSDGRFIRGAKRTPEMTSLEKSSDSACDAGRKGPAGRSCATVCFLIRTTLMSSSSTAGSKCERHGCWIPLRTRPDQNASHTE